MAVEKDIIEVSIKLSKAEGKSLVWLGISREWQQYWDYKKRNGRHLYSGRTEVRAVRSRGGNGRQDVVLARL